MSVSDSIFNRHHKNDNELLIDSLDFEFPKTRTQKINMDRMSNAYYTLFKEYWMCVLLVQLFATHVSVHLINLV